ncbi:MAG TPA: hypothetical protein VHZ76_10105 [Gammaproteobacteria bacterium]|jgi:hypothetical protein|nr:hypothetical protein [Gammaproteobacteria bacterium]
MRRLLHHFSIKFFLILIFFLNTNTIWAQQGESITMQNTSNDTGDKIQLSPTDEDNITRVQPYDMAAYDQ